MPRTFRISLFALLLAALPAAADMSWDQTTVTVLNGPAPKTLSTAKISFAFKPNVLRQDVDGQPTQFFNFENGSVIAVSYETSTFLPATIEGLAAYQAGERERLRGQLPASEAKVAAMPEPARAEQTALLTAQKRKYELWAQPYSARPTAEVTMVNGHRARKWEGYAGTELFQEIWVAEDITPDPTFSSLLAPKLAAFDPQDYSHLGQVRSFPVRVVSRYDAVTVTSDVSNFTAAPVPADAFIIPADFMLSKNASWKKN